MVKSVLRFRSKTFASDVKGRADRVTFQYCMLHSSPRHRSVYFGQIELCVVVLASDKSGLTKRWQPRPEQQI